jgi:AsmA protein
MLKQWVLVVAAVVFLILFLISLVPFFVNAEALRPSIESQLSNALGREVTVGKVTFSIMAGSLDAEDISIADDPQYSAVPFIQAKKLDVGVELLPIVFHHEVHITKLNIDTPSIQLIQNASGKWNFSSIGRTSAQPGATEQSTSVPDLTVEELKITDGSATVSSIPITNKPFEYTEVNLTVTRFSFLKSFPFKLSAKLPGEGSMNLDGDAGPISQKDTTHTPFQAALQLRNFDPVASGVIDQSKGITMRNDVDAQLKSGGTDVSSTGKIKASGLQLVPRGSPAQDPVDIDYTISHNIETQKGTVSDIAIHAGTVAVHMNGSFQFTPQDAMLDLRLAAPNLPIDQLERLLPVVGIHLPTGSSLQGGTLTANITFTGPATTATMAGPVEIDNTTLAGFDLGSKIQGLNSFGGNSSGTQIHVLKANVNSSPQGARITDIYGDLPQLGSATGEGTIAESGAINFNLKAKLNSSNPVGAVTNHALLTITGTAASPSIKANIGAILK